MRELKEGALSGNAEQFIEFMLGHDGSLATGAVFMPETSVWLVGACFKPSSGEEPMFLAMTVEAAWRLTKVLDKGQEIQDVKDFSTMMRAAAGQTMLMQRTMPEGPRGTVH